MMGTGRQLHVGSMVTSSNSELVERAMGEELRLRVSRFGDKFVYTHPLRPMSTLLLCVKRPRRAVHILFGEVRILGLRKTSG